MDIRFKTVLNPLVQGDVPQYRALVQHNGTANLDSLSKGIAEDCGLKPAVVKSVLELFFEHLADEFRNGMRVNLEQLEGGLTIRGSAESSNEPWSKGNLKLEVFLHAKGDLKKSCAGVNPVNVTDAESVIVRRVLDTVYERDGLLGGVSQVLALLAGSGLGVNLEAEDEGVYLTDYKTDAIVKVGTVTARTSTTLDVTFDSLPPDGTYWLVVASRNGYPEKGVSIGRRKVTVKAVPDEEVEA